MTLAQPSFHVRVTIDRVEGGNVCLGGRTCRCLARFAVLGVVQGPHASPVVVVGAPEIFLAFEGLHKSIILLAVVVLGGFILPCPFVL